MSCEIDHEAATHPTAHMQMTQQEARMPHTALTAVAVACGWVHVRSLWKG